MQRERAISQARHDIGQCNATSGLFFHYDRFVTAVEIVPSRFNLIESGIRLEVLRAPTQSFETFCLGVRVGGLPGTSTLTYFLTRTALGQ